MLESALQPTLITGTSAGAINGAIVTQTINEFGFGSDARLKVRKNFKKIWDDIALPDYTAQAIENVERFMSSFFPWHHSIMTSHNKSNFSNGLQRMLNGHFINLNALQDNNNVSLIVNAVNKDTGQEKYFTGKSLGVDTLMASAALPHYLSPVRYNGDNYIDGACFGGSNPPFSPHLEQKKPLDAIICIMTNPPVHPIKLAKQKNLMRADVQDTDNLILYQAYNEVALLLSQQECGAKTPPIHVIYPPIDEPWTKHEKQYLGRTELMHRFKLGQKSGSDFIQSYGHVIGYQSTETVESLRKRSNRLKPASLAFA
jgi:NTE family protein